MLKKNRNNIGFYMMDILYLKLGRIDYDNADFRYFS
jgi:hypothetical protein